jgi:hypothetical protein
MERLKEEQGTSHGNIPGYPYQKTLACRQCFNVIWVCSFISFSLPLISSNPEYQTMVTI